jgi:hypothetical protein
VFKHITLEGNIEQGCMLILDSRRATVSEIMKRCTLVTVLPIELFTIDTTSIKFV